jgi:Ca2+-binding RTX toxin-like protein
VDFATVYNDGATADQAGTLTSTTLTGLGMAKGITYGSFETLDIFLGLGKDIFDVNSTMKRDDGFRTVTMVSTGSGDDTVTVALNADTDGFFALNTEGGDDKVYASTSTLPLIVFGGEGDDWIEGGQGDDILFGDKGRIDYRDSIGKLITRLGLGLAERIVLQPGQAEDSVDDVPFKQTDGVVRGPVLITSREPGIGGVDDLQGNDGADTIVGGAAGDTITGDAGDDLVFGDEGKVSLIGGIRQQVTSINEGVGGNDTIHGDAGNDAIFGGAADDWLYGEDGNNLLFGDSGSVTYAAGQITMIETIAPAVGGADLVYANGGNDTVLGGQADDTI